MKLGKLLAAGQSIMNGRTDISYRSNKQIYLPKFGPPRNPFKSEAALPDNLDYVRGSETEPKQVEPVAKNMSVGGQNPPPASAHDAKKTWADKLNPISIFRAVPAKTAPLGPSAGKGQKTSAMQTELSLDSVRVVHNDLSDVDVEVVPIKSRPIPSEAKPGKSSWGMLGERLFGVEPT